MRTPPVAWRLLSAVRQRPSLLRNSIPQPCTPHLILLRRSSTEGLSSTTTPPQQPPPLSEPSENAATSPETSGLHISRVLSRIVIPREQQRPGPGNSKTTDSAASSLQPPRPNIFRPHVITRTQQKSSNPTDPAAASSTPPPPRLKISRFELTKPPRTTGIPRVIRKVRNKDTPVQHSIANDVTASLHPYQHTYSFLGNFKVSIVPDKLSDVKINQGEPLFLFQEPNALNARVKKVRVENFNGTTLGYLDIREKAVGQLIAAGYLTFAGMCTGFARGSEGNVPATVEVHVTSPWENEAKELWKREFGRDPRRKNKHQNPSPFALNAMPTLQRSSIVDEITQSLRPPQKMVSYGFFHSNIIGTNHFPGNATMSTGDVLTIRRDASPRNAVRASTLDGITVGYLTSHQAGCFTNYLKEGVLKLEAMVTKFADHEFPHNLPVKIELLGSETRKDELARLFAHLERTWNFQRAA